MLALVKQVGRVAPLRAKSRRASQYPLGIRALVSCIWIRPRDPIQQPQLNNQLQETVSRLRTLSVCTEAIHRPARWAEANLWSVPEYPDRGIPQQCVAFGAPIGGHRNNLQSM